MLVRKLAFAVFFLALLGLLGFRLAEGLRTVPMPPVAEPFSERRPRTLNEGLDILSNVFTSEQLAEMRHLSEKEMVYRYYLNLGRDLRNEWGLWSGKSGIAAEFCSKGLQDGEAMSVVILQSFWRRVHSVPLRVEEQIQEAKAADAKNLAEWRRAHPDELHIRLSGCPVRDWIG